MMKELLSAFARKAKASPMWLLLPAAAVLCAAAFAADGYEPLVFDPSQYPAQTAQADELKTIDAKKVEKEGSDAAAEEAAETMDSATVAKGALADGTWTGYAACGKGNPDGWKPYYVAVTIKVADGKVTGITDIRGTSNAGSGKAALNWDAAENQAYLDRAVSGRGQDAGVKAQLSAQLPTSGSVSSVDTVSGATYSSAAIYNAFVDACNRAAKAGGAKSTKTKKATAKKSSGKKSTGSEQVVAKTEVGTLADGTWTGYAPCGEGNEDGWKPYYVAVVLTVKDGKVVSVDRIYGSSTGDEGSAALDWDESENSVYLEGAVYGVGEQIKAAITSGITLARIDTVSSCTYSSKAIFAAYYEALKKAASAAGSTVAEPAASTADSEPANVASDQTSEEPAESADTQNTASYYGFARCESGGGDSWSPYYIFVQLAVSEDGAVKIAKAYGDAEGIVDKDVVYDAAENSLYLGWAVDGKFGGTGYRMKSVVTQIQAKIDAGSAVSGISTVSGATRSSKSIIEAYKMAAKNMANATGTTPQEAVSVAAEAG